MVETTWSKPCLKMPNLIWGPRPKGPKVQPSKRYRPCIENKWKIWWVPWIKHRPILYDALFPTRTKRLVSFWFFSSISEQNCQIVWWFVCLVVALTCRTCHFRRHWFETGDASIDMQRRTWRHTYLPKRVSESYAIQRISSKVRVLKA